MKPGQRFARHERRKLLLAVLAPAAGLALLLAYYRWVLPLTAAWPLALKVALALGPLLAFAAAVVYAASQARGRAESAAAYKRRTRFREEAD
jgi:hypothetical protein